MKTCESISELMASHLFLNSPVCIYFTGTLVVIVSKSLQNLQIIPWNQFYSLMLQLGNNQHLFWEKLQCKKGQKQLVILNLWTFVFQYSPWRIYISCLLKGKSLDPSYSSTKGRRCWAAMSHQLLQLTAYLSHDDLGPLPPLMNCHFHPQLKISPEDLINLSPEQFS